MGFFRLFLCRILQACTIIYYNTVECNLHYVCSHALWHILAPTACNQTLSEGIHREYLWQPPYIAPLELPHKPDLRPTNINIDATSLSKKKLHINKKCSSLLEKKFIKLSEEFWYVTNKCLVTNYVVIQQEYKLF